MTRWQIFSAVALRKLPEIIPRKDIIELKVQEIFSAQELAHSRYSRHELEDNVIAQDREEAWNKQKELFIPAKHDERLSLMQYLFKRQKFGSDIKDQWLLPQAEYDPKQDEHLFDTARRALKESINIDDGYKIVSKIPSSVYVFKYPRKIVDQTGAVGAKVFFMKAHLDLPSEFVLNQTRQEEYKDLKWLTRKEAMDGAEVHKRYMISLSAGLLHENKVNVNRILLKASAHK